MIKQAPLWIWVERQSSSLPSCFESQSHHRHHPKWGTRFPSVSRSDERKVSWSNNNAPDEN
ncbi:hypothetical protein BDV97DRAFT_363614 [Delphinella strobiligena]|nr:hypothetical protein BDV97DRAFT_363614 [Delphinella strobiligena]